jgi:hypothetical protein
MVRRRPIVMSAIWSLSGEKRTSRGHRDIGGAKFAVTHKGRNVNLASAAPPRRLRSARAENRGCQ